MSICLGKAVLASRVRRAAVGLLIACGWGIGVGCPAYAATAPLTIQPTIAGGQKTSAPWAVKIVGQGTWCSAVAIDPNWVITAAHCPVPEQVLFSTGSVSNGSAGTVRSDRAMNSPNGDVKLVHLSTTHALAAYPQIDLDYLPQAGDTGTIYGLGGPEYGQLREATIEVLDAATDYSNGLGIHLVGISGGSQPGDSGGPLLVNGKLVGVDSAGTGNNDVHAESWYANLAGSKDFLASVLVGTPTLEGGSVSMALGREFFYSKQRIMIWVNGRYAAETYNGAPYYAYAEPTDSGVTLHLGSGVKAGDYVQVGIVSGVPGNTPPSPSSAQMLAYAYLDTVRSVTLVDGRANAELGSWLFKSNQRVMFWINGQYAGETYQGVAYYASATFDSLRIRPYTVGSQTSEGVVIRPGTAVKDGDEIQIGIVPGVPGNSPPPPSSAQVLANVVL
jgi:Trypsin